MNIEDTIDVSIENNTIYMNGFDIPLMYLLKNKKYRFKLATPLLLNENKLCFYLDLDIDSKLTNKIFCCNTG